MIKGKKRKEGFILGEYMKNIIKILSIIFLLLGGNLYSKSYERVLSNIVDDLYPRTKEECKALVIFEPEYLDKRKSSSGKTMQEKLIILFGKKIGKKKEISVVERNQIDKIYQEYKIQTSGLVDDKSITRLGRMLGADCLLTTTLSDLVDEVEINSRIIKMETGEVVSTASGKIKKENLALWRERTNYTEGNYVYSVGHSEPEESEETAIDQARLNALSSLVRYAGSEITVLNRIYEGYSDKKGESSNIESNKQVFASAFVKNVSVEDTYIRKEKGKYIAWVLISISTEEFKRIQEESTRVKLSVDIGFYYEEGKKLVPFYENDVLHSGQGYTMYINPSDTCYLYLFQVDSLGNVSKLFPNKEYHTLDNPLLAAKKIWIPNENEVFYLDETTGEETIFIVASRNKIPEFERDDFSDISLKDLRQTVSLKRMGVAGVRDKIANTLLEDKKRGALELKKKLQSSGDFYYEMKFWHK